jgi:hypothetical protein
MQVYCPRFDSGAVLQPIAEIAIAVAPMCADNCSGRPQPGGELDQVPALAEANRQGIRNLRCRLCAGRAVAPWHRCSAQIACICATVRLRSCVPCGLSRPLPGQAGVPFRVGRDIGGNAWTGGTGGACPMDKCRVCTGIPGIATCTGSGKLLAWTFPGQQWPWSGGLALREGRERSTWPGPPSAWLAGK